VLRIKGKRRPRLTIAAEVAAVVAVLGPLAGWALLHVPDGGRARTATSPGARAGAATSAPTPGAPPVPATAATDRKGQIVYVADELVPDTGGANRGRLPHPLEGASGYGHALVIPCATNQATDKFRSVTYLLNGHYTKLHAALRPYLKVSDESVVQVQIFLDQQPPTGKNVVVNAADSVDVDVFGATRMEMRVTCESPDATAILADAYVQHS
jgi:hypothetical protein